MTLRTYHEIIEDASFRVEDEPSVLPPFDHIGVFVKLAPKLLPQLVHRHSAVKTKPKIALT